MKIAKGTKSWIIFPIPFIIISILGIYFLSDSIQGIFLFIFIILIILECFFIIFFRDPERIIGKGIVSSADGIIQFIDEIQDNDVGDSICISIFMNVHNVHVNRMPFDGKILKITHISGGYLPAFKKDSDQNERVITVIQTKYGPMKIIQIAGTLARRIVIYSKKGQNLSKGQRFGMIKLGSRVDIILPKKFENNLKIKIGDKVLAGVDTICSDL